MTHRAKVDVYILAAIILAMIVFLLGDYWIAGPILLILFLCAYPQSYETTARALVIRLALCRHVIPYSAIHYVGPSAEDAGPAPLTPDGVKIQYGRAAEILISPADREAFFRDLAARAPHLIKRGQRLFAAFA
jgi:Bacterial PH domain